MSLAALRPHGPILFGTIVAALVAALCVLPATNARAADPKNQDPAMLRHVVLFQFKKTSTEADVARIVEAFRGLPTRIPQIKAFEWGTDVSPEGKAQGFTHCFLVTFANEADRDAYLPHPAHMAFVSIVGPHVEKVCVVDFWARP